MALMVQPDLLGDALSLPSPADLALEQADPASLQQAAAPLTRLDIFNSYLSIFIIAFVVTLVATPIMRRLALANGIVDDPSDKRKVHRTPVAYLGGVAVFLGLMAGVFFSYIAPAIGGSLGEMLSFHPTRYLSSDGAMPNPVPLSILMGMTIIMLLGLIDDVVGTLPRLKIAGMFVAGAALAYEDVGVRLAQGVLGPTLGALLHNEALTWTIHMPITGTPMVFDLIYWTGTAIIALFVLGACNASNLIDGLDGLLTGVTSIAALGLLIIALSLALIDDGPRDGQRLVLAMALLGACLGFLPYNFNPASIFLGDCGSLLLGYTTIVIVLTLGDRGQTHLVLAGLVIYAIPIIDTVLAIVRRKLAGQSISVADDQHLHHMLKRALGVKGAVFTLYGIGIGFAALGVAMSLWRARAIYALVLIFASYIAVFAIKKARMAAADQAESSQDQTDELPSPEQQADDGGETLATQPAEPVAAGSSRAS